MPAKTPMRSGLPGTLTLALVGLGLAVLVVHQAVAFFGEVLTSLRPWVAELAQVARSGRFPL